MTPDPTGALRDVIRQLVREELRAALDERATTQAAHVVPVQAGGPSTEYINDVQLAEWLGVSRETVQAWRRTPGEGPPFHRVARRAVRYSVPEVRAWLAARRCGK